MHTCKKMIMLLVLSLSLSLFWGCGNKRPSFITQGNCFFEIKLKNLEYKNNTLFFDNIDITELTKKIKTPFYLYSENLIKNNISDYLSGGSDKTIFCYSVKANSNLSLLKLIASQGLGFDVVSKGELHRAIRAGANPKNCLLRGR